MAEFNEKQNDFSTSQLSAHCRTNKNNIRRITWSVAITFTLCTLRHVVVDQLAPSRQVDGYSVIVKAKITMVDGRDIAGRR